MWLVNVFTVHQNPYHLNYYKDFFNVKNTTQISYTNSLCQTAFQPGVCHMYRILKPIRLQSFYKRSLKKKTPLIYILMRQVICMFTECLINPQTHLAHPYKTPWYICTFFPSVLYRGYSDFFVSCPKFSRLKTPIHLSRSSSNVTSSEKPTFIFRGRISHFSHSRPSLLL